MPPIGDYLLTNTGFSQDKPVISLSKDGVFTDFSPLESETLTLTFDTATRHCVGWRDITTGERFVCPDSSVVDSKYEQCAGCQKRTGFNPAFYHAASVSPQQEARNNQPHILYLAYFGGDLIKVGISHAARGHNRLLEQGARMAIVLDTFPTAMIARQYEAKIAALPGIAETVATRQKIATLSTVCDSAKLLAVQQQVMEALSVDLHHSDVLSFDEVYFPNTTPDLTDSCNTADQASISGQPVGMLGSLLFCRQQDTLLLLPVKKFVGYSVTIDDQEKLLALPERQLTFF